MTNPSQLRMLQRNLAMSVRFNFVLFSLDPIRLIEALSHRGFEISPPPRVELPARARLVATGEIARKGDCHVSLDHEKQTLTVKGPSPGATMKTLDELEQTIADELQIKIQEHAKFFELIARYECDSDSSPLDCVGRALSQNAVVKLYGDIVNENLSLFSLRLVPKSRVPDTEDWLDITLEPSVIRPTKTYVISVVYRNAQKARVWSFADTLESNLTRLVELVEGAQEKGAE